eukprot:2786228-Prymnesium_polylepis.1
MGVCCVAWHGLTWRVQRARAVCHVPALGDFGEEGRVERVRTCAMSQRLATLARKDSNAASSA